MIRRIKLQNFMSHWDTEIEFGPGLNVITGDNNIGKSAIVVALDYLCRGNRPGDFFCTHDREPTRVTVETEEPDGSRHIIWRAPTPRSGAGTQTWGIDDREGVKNLPSDWHDYLRLGESELKGTTTLSVHIGEQKKPQFLLDETPSDRARFLGQTSDVRFLLRMRDLHKVRIRESERDLTNRRKELAEIEASLAPLEKAPAVLERTNLLAAEIAALRASEQQSLQIEEAAHALDEQIRQVDSLERRARALSPLAPPPELADETNLRDRLAALEAKQREAAGLRSRWRALETLEAPPSIVLEQPLETLATQIDRAERVFRRMQRERQALDRLEAPPALLDEKVMSETLARLANAEDELDRSRRLRRVLARLEPAPELADLGALEACANSLEVAQVQLERHAKELQVASQELERAFDDMQRFVSEYPYCPTCGAPLDAKRLVEAGHVDG